MVWLILTELNIIKSEKHLYKMTNKITLDSRILQLLINPLNYNNQSKNNQLTSLTNILTEVVRLSRVAFDQISNFTSALTETRTQLIYAGNVQWNVRVTGRKYWTCFARINTKIMIMTMLNYVRQFFKIRVVFHALYLWHEAGVPRLFLHFRIQSN